MSRTELLDAKQSPELVIVRAAKLLRAGQLVAFPTDTVYGVAAILSHPQAILKLYEAKERPREKAIPILLATSQDLARVATHIEDWVWRLVKHFWPGGLTLVLTKSEQVPPEVSVTPTVAVRLPNLALTRQIISAAGLPLAVTSANRSTHPNPHSASEVISQLGERIAAVVDGGRTPGDKASTVLDCTVYPPRILRAGAIPVDALRQITPVTI